MTLFPFTHCPASGVKVIVLPPILAKAGSNKLPEVPGPDQTPEIPIGLVVSVIGPSDEQRSEKGPSITSIAVFTVTLTGAGVLAHSLTSGVNVKMLLPALGSKLLPITPRPLQEPITPSCVVLSDTVASLSQNGPIGESTGVVFIQVIVILEKVTDSFAAQV